MVKRSETINTWRELRDSLNRQSEENLDGQIISQGEDGQIEPSILLDVWMDEIDEYRLCIVPIVNVLKN